MSAAVSVAAGGGPGAAKVDTGGPAARKDSDWGYAWIPVLGPLVGGAIAGLLSQVVF